jgi:iron(III) transport system permease protein
VSARAPWRPAGVSGAVLLVALSVLPIAILVPAALANLDVAAEVLSPRRLGLLLSSVRLASIVLIIDTTIATGAVLWAAAAGKRRALPVMAIALAAAFVPPVAHAAAWTAVADALRRLMGLAVTPLTGLPAAALAQGTAFLPLTVAIGMAGVMAVDPLLLDAARVSRTDSSAMIRVLVPLAMPMLLAGGGVAALLSLGDEAVPSAFGVETGAMELFSAYAADGRAGATLALAWPLTLVAVATAALCALPLRRVSLRASAGRPLWSTPPFFGLGTRAAVGAGAALAVAGSALTFGALAVAAWPPGAAGRAIAAAAPDIATTCFVALTCAVIATVVGLLAGTPARPASNPARWVWGIALLAAVVPAPVVGAGLVALYNHAATASVYDSVAMPVLASLARFAPLAALAVSLAATRLDRSPLEASLISGRPARAFGRVVLPQLLAPAVGGGLLVGAFAAGELGATVMVIPPGTSTAVVRAFNLLHYGSSEQVAAIALATAAIGIASAAAASLVVGRVRGT